MTTITCTAAEFALNADLIGLSNYTYLRTSAVARKIRRLGMTGSTNPGDCALAVYYGAEKIGEFYNTTGGANVVPKADDMKYLDPNKWLPKGTPLSLKVIDAAATNPVFVELEFVDYMPPRSSAYKVPEA